MTITRGSESMNWLITLFRKFYVSIAILTSTAQGKMGFIITLFTVLIALCAPLFPYPGPKWSNPTLQFALPSTSPSLWYILGTDYLGIPLVLDVIWGLRYFLEIGIIAGALTISVGTLLGLLSGYLGGIIDRTLNFAFNLVLTIPTFALWLVLAVIFRSGSPIILGIILGILSWAGLARSIRAATIGVKNRDYVEASRLLGLSPLSVIVSDVIPTILPYIVMNFVLSIVSGFYGAMGLAFLGLIPFSNINWGAILNAAFYQDAAIFSLSGTVPVLILVIIESIILLGLIYFANASVNVFDPRARRQVEIKLAIREESR